MGINDILNSLIYDRTQADVDYALSLQQNSVHAPENLRGAYNVSDRNRVGSAINWLIDAMNMLRFRAKDNWNEYDITKLADNANTLDCLTELKRLLSYGVVTAIPVDLDKLSYQKANNVERVLYQIGSAYAWISELYAGDGYASDFDAKDMQIFDDNWNFNFTLGG